MDRRPGCLVGLLQLFALNAVHDWLQENFGFGQGCSCTGIGCGVIMLFIFLMLACSIITGTDWTDLLLIF